MKPHIGLYYPFIHFRDDNWLKAAALYWDKMGRIVPYDFVTQRDSETVLRLAGELDFIANFNPGEWCGPLCDRFAQVLTRHQGALRARYDVTKRDTWKVDPHTLANAPPDSEPTLAYVFGGKMDPGFIEQLEDLRLGVRGRGHDLLWVGMHPRLASVYMNALAAQTAEDVNAMHLHPMTDEPDDHVALGSWTMERLAQGLLGDDVHLPAAPIAEDEVATRLAAVALETVLPANLAGVDVEAIIKLRKERRDELTAFQSWMHSFAQPLLEELAGMQSRDALTAHLDVVVARDVKPRLEDFRKQLNSVGIEAVRGALNIKLEAPLLLAGAAAALGFVVNPVAGAVAGLSVGLFDTARSARESAARLDRTPAYLLHLQEGLNPQTMLGWIQNRLRRFVTGV